MPARPQASGVACGFSCMPCPLSLHGQGCEIGVILEKIFLNEDLFVEVTMEGRMDEALL